MSMSLEVDSAIQVQILNKAVCISYCPNALSKCMNPTTLPPAMDKQSDRPGSLTLAWQSV